jgi:hypothetical protein
VTKVRLEYVRTRTSSLRAKTLFRYSREQVSDIAVVVPATDSANSHSVTFPDRVEDCVGEDSLVRVVDLFVDELDLPLLGFTRSARARNGRPGITLT